MLVVLTDPGCPGQVLESHKQFCACISMSPIKPDKQNNISSPCFTQMYQSLLSLMICHTHRNSFLYSAEWESQFATDSPVTGHWKIFWLMSQCGGAITVRIVILLKQRLAVISTVDFIYTCVSVWIREAIKEPLFSWLHMNDDEHQPASFLLVFWLLISWNLIW